MHKVERAIIMAAGFGSRLRPLTEKTPKPLLEVNGYRIIDTILDALYENHIREIYIVVGYLKEKFKVLAQKYPTIQFIENPYYEKSNNISSLYMARNYIKNTVILDGDQIIRNGHILKNTFKKSGYACAWTETYTKEWLVTLDKERFISCNKDGGEKGWQLYSISFWDEKQGQLLAHWVEKEFEDFHNEQIFWDDVPMFIHKDKFDLSIQKISHDDIIEIDSFEDLERYRNSNEI